MDNLLQRFRLELYTGLDIDPTQLLIVGVSGGADSMALSKMLLMIRHPHEVAHVNYKLRGTSSDEDEKLVRAYCAREGLVCHMLDASGLLTKETSVQEEARHIRYTWFEELRISANASHIAVAHHADDQAETILHQFVRGGRLAALRGMKQHTEQHIIRPLLHFTKKELHSFAVAMGVEWREDASNASDKYTRNVIRHKIIPALEEINPSIVASLASRASYFAEVEHMMRDVTEKALNEHLQRVDERRSSLAISFLSHYPYREVLLWQWLKPHGFSPEQCVDAQKLMRAETGAYIASSDARLWCDRGQLVLEMNGHTEDHLHLDNFIFDITTPLPITSRLVSGMNNKPEDAAYVAWFDAEQLALPLTLRRWKDGDKIAPYGMSGHQKVSDVLTQRKISTAQRNEVYVLCSGDHIIWIPGIRNTAEAIVDSHSRAIIRMELLRLT